jgi:hypothetical protein
VALCTIGALGALATGYMRFGMGVIGDVRHRPGLFRQLDRATAHAFGLCVLATILAVWITLHRPQRPYRRARIAGVVVGAATVLGAVTCCQLVQVIRLNGAYGE